MNLVPMSHDGQSLAFGSTPVPVDAAVAGQLTGLGATDATLGVRPQNPTLGDTGVPAEVMVVEELGSETFAFLEMEHLGQPARVRVRVDGDYPIGRGERTHIGVLGPVHAFGPDGLRLLTEDETGA